MALLVERLICIVPRFYSKICLSCVEQRFKAVIMRIREPKATALIFASGKVVCTGARTEIDSRLAARKFARIIKVRIMCD